MGRIKSSLFLRRINGEVAAAQRLTEGFVGSGRVGKFVQRRFRRIGPAGQDHQALVAVADGQFVSHAHAAVELDHLVSQIERCGSDEGPPGLRYSPNFYSCYVRDPDGNKLSAVCTAAE